MRAAAVQLCRDPKGFIPIGANPWRGAPIPYGTPVQDGRNILPPNKFPFIPPAADYDPGAPVVALPPGTPPGPGPAPNAPFPLPVPPNNNPPAPPWPYFAPPDQVLPPYARQPLEAPSTTPTPTYPWFVGSSPKTPPSPPPFCAVTSSDPPTSP